MHRFFIITLFCIGIEKLKFKIQKFRSSVRVFRVHLKKEIKFSVEFIDTIIKKSGEEIRNVDFSEALGSLSTIGTNFKGYLNADRVFNKHKKLFSIEKSDDMKYIVIRENEELACSKKNRYRISATGGFAGATFGAAVEFAEANKDAWSNKKASVQDQLRNLNGNHTEFEFKLEQLNSVSHNDSECFVILMNHYESV